MKKVYLVNPALDKLNIKNYDFDLFEKQVKWLCTLERTKRGKIPYRITNNSTAIIFTRYEDAVAFKLIFKV